MYEGEKMGNIKHYYYRALNLNFNPALVCSINISLSSISYVWGVYLNVDGTSFSRYDSEYLEHNKVLESCKVKKWEI